MPSYWENRFVALIQWAECLDSTDGRLASLMLRDLWNEVQSVVARDILDAEEPAVGEGTECTQ